jgi:N-acetylglucosaminyldiphosphoundecaprenol N-acetyl-beta-D-mannosaminyltransferase
VKKMVSTTLKKDLNKAKILGISFNSTPRPRLLEILARKVAQKVKATVVTPNPEFCTFAYHRGWFKALLNRADYAVPDGIGLIWAARLLKQPIKERIAGVDLMEDLCQLAAKNGWKVFLVGGKPGVAEGAAHHLKGKYPGLKVWSESGGKLSMDGNGKWSEESLKEIERLVEKIDKVSPDLLFVGLGMGKQEKFIFDNWKKLNVRLAMGVGGAFDYLSGRVHRAPRWMRNVGFEWLFRLIRQPWRIGRQLALLEFVRLVFRERVNFKKTL